MGYQAGHEITSFGNTCIGAGVLGFAGEFNTIRINDNLPPLAGSTSKVFIYGIDGADVTPASTAVYVNANGQLGTLQSSARFKKDIDPMGKTSEAIFSLKPVTFHYKGDPKNTPCFGLIAEEVAEVNPELALRDEEGKPFTVRYEQINAMLLNEFLKEHRKVQKLETNDAEQQREIKALVATVKEQAAQIQKVSAQLEVNQHAPQTVLNNR